MENSIANHEFEKARFYSGEEKKECEALRQLRRTHKLDQRPGLAVTREDVETVVAKLTGLSVTEIRHSRGGDPPAPRER